MYSSRTGSHLDPSELKILADLLRFNLDHLLLIMTTLVSTDLGDLGRLLSLSLNFEPLQKTLADLAGRIAAAERVLPDKAEHSIVGQISENNARVSGDLASQLASAFSRIRILEDGAAAAQRSAMEAEASASQRLHEAEDRLASRLQSLEDDIARGRTLATEQSAAASARTSELEGKVTVLSAELAAARAQAVTDAKSIAEALSAASMARDLSESTASRLGTRVRVLEESLQTILASQQSAQQREASLMQRLSTAEEKLAASAAAVVASREAATAALAALSQSVDTRFAALNDLGRRTSAIDADILTLRNLVDRCNDGVTALKRDALPPLASATRKAEVRVDGLEEGASAARTAADALAAEVALLRERLDAFIKSAATPMPAAAQPTQSGVATGSGSDAQLAALRDMIGSKADGAAFSALRVRVTELWKLVSVMQTSAPQAAAASGAPGSAALAMSFERGAFTGRQLLQVRICRHLFMRYGW